MAGTISVSAAEIVGKATRYTVQWTSDSSGAVSGNSFDVKGGGLLQLKFIPGSGGTQPTDAYDVVINDADGIDVLRGGGANLSNAVGSYSTPPDGAPVLLLEAGPLTPVISNAGNAKSGTIVLYFWP
jgi:hypothetical protein